MWEWRRRTIQVIPLWPPEQTSHHCEPAKIVKWARECAFASNRFCGDPSLHSSQRNVLAGAVKNLVSSCPGHEQKTFRRTWPLAKIWSYVRIKSWRWTLACDCCCSVKISFAEWSWRPRELTLTFLTAALITTSPSWISTSDARSCCLWSRNGEPVGRVRRCGPAYLKHLSTGEERRRGKVINGF